MAPTKKLNYYHLTKWQCPASLYFEGRFFDSNLLVHQCHDTAQKMKFSIKDLFSKCDQIHRKLRIWPQLLKKSLMENSIFCAVWQFHFLDVMHIDCKSIFFDSHNLFRSMLECKGFARFYLYLITSSPEQF